MTVEISQLWPGDDLSAATQLFDQYRQFYEQQSDPAACRAWLAMRLQAGQSALFIAKLDEQAVGLMQLYPSFCSVKLTPIWVLYDLYVSKEARGHGVGKALLKKAEQFGRSQGAGYLQLCTAYNNRTAQKLYERNGWERDEVFFTYTLSLE